jgi:DNA-binding transcriptional regulator YdaS (Cro superfamily)
MRNKVRAKLAKELGVSIPLVKHWENGIRRIPAEQAIPIAYATNWQITLPELRSDIYPTDYRPPWPAANTASTPSAG